MLVYPGNPVVVSNGEGNTCFPSVPLGRCLPAEGMPRAGVELVDDGVEIGLHVDESPVSLLVAGLGLAVRLGSVPSVEHDS